MVNLANQALCKRCGRGMRTVAEIAPFGDGPGLIAFLCTDCGATASTLLYSAATASTRKGPGVEQAKAE
jgi:hypothetical protein